MNNLVSACFEMATPESLEYAQKAVEQYTDERGVEGSLFMYNSLIRGYSLADLGESGISLYVKMVQKGLFPDKYTFPFVLSACSKISGFREGLQFHGALVKMNLDADMYVQNSLIHFYFERGDVVNAHKVFDKMLEKNVVSWTSLICGYARRDHPREAVSLFFDMVDAGVEPNSVTMVCVISACSKLQDLALGKQVCDYLEGTELKLNTHMVNAIVDMYMKCGAFENAKRIFEACCERNLVLYNTIMSNYARKGMASEALAILDEMLREGSRPDRVTMLSAISACATLEELMLGKWCHSYAWRNGLENWESICNAIIDMYMKCGTPNLALRVFGCMPNKTIVSWNSLMAGYVRNGNLELAREIFTKMPERDLVSWNTMIGALVQESLFEEAIQLFRTMQNEGIKADRVTMVSIASACGYLGASGLAKWVYRYIQETTQINRDMHLDTALIDMFGRCGDPESAMLVFDEMEHRDVSAWTAAIGARAMEGNGEAAIELFDEMVKDGLKPDGVTFAGLLTACSHGGLVEKGWDIFNSMEEIYEISPSIVHYGCMVDLLGRAGLVLEALDFMERMRLKPNDIICSALVAACRKHKHAADKAAAYVTDRLKELDSFKTGIPVLLSNLYASEGKWIDVSRVRVEMKERGMHKVPGSSSIEVGGEIREFTSGYESDPEILLMLEEMNWRLRQFGHVPNLENVFVDVDDQEKELLLGRHSEKVAIAYGLISTVKRTKIRIAKNLRMCLDCHAFAKMVSLVYEREITVRDQNRFHFFKQGKCSCKDDW